MLKVKSKQEIHTWANFKEGSDASLFTDSVERIIKVKIVNITVILFD